MNAFYFTQRTFASRILATVALFSLIASMLPIQAFAAVGEVNTVTGSCGAPVNANQYEEGQAVLLKGKNFTPNVTLNWDITEVGGANPTVLASGTILTDAQGEFCFTAINALGVGTNLESPYKATAGGKSDNFSVVESANNNGTITVVKSLVNPPLGVTADDFSFTVNGGSATQFEADGSNASIQNLNDGPFSVVEVQANGTGYTTTYSGCSAIALTSNGATCTITNTYTIVPPPVLGCTDVTAKNYNPAATEDDGSCIPVVLGCMDPLANNFDADANTSDGSCSYDIRGCTNPTADNYDPSANIDDGSCIIPVTGCTNPDALNYNADATEDDGSCVLPVEGCTDDTANNYDAGANVNDGSCTYDVSGCTNPLASNYNVLANIDDGSCILPPPPVLGCTDETANNYNPAATEDDGSCDFGGGDPDPVYGCTDDSATNFNPRANTDDQSCIYNYVSQCGDTPNLLVNGSFEDNVGLSAGNWGIFNPILGWGISNDGLEIWNQLLIVPSNGNQNAELDGNSPSTISQTVATIPGATYELRFDLAARSDASSAADNHVEATVDTVSVVNQSTTNTNWTTYGGTFVADGSTDVVLSDLGTPNSLGTLIDNAVLCLVSEPEVLGCTDPEATNYNANATVDNESCTYSSGGGGGSTLPRCTLFEGVRDGSEVTLNWETTRGTRVVITSNGDEVYETIDSDEVDAGAYRFENTGSAEYLLTVYRGSKTRTCSTEVLEGVGPTPQVLGEQVSAIPLGAADTGAGGTSPVQTSSSQIMSAIVLRNLMRVSRNG